MAIVYPKWWLKSKGTIFNILTILFLAGPYLSDFLMHLLTLPELQPHAKVILSLVAGINFLLRFRTVVPVSLSSAPPPIELVAPHHAGTPKSAGSKKVATLPATTPPAPPKT